MTEITRIFDRSQNATEAANELMTNNFADVRLTKEPAPNDQHGDDASGALKDAGAVLSVEVPFGRGQLAEQILSRHGPSKPVRSEGGVSSRRITDSGHGDDAAPFSSMLGLPVLAESKPTTVSSLGDQSPTFTSGLLSNDFYVSSLFGLPLLTSSTPRAALIDNPAPLSSMLGLPVLLRASRGPQQTDRPIEREVDHPAKPLETTELRSRVG